MNAQRSLFHDQAPMFDEIMTLWNSTGEWLSRAAIAVKLGRSKSPTLIATIEMLVASGYLTKRVIDLPNHAEYFQYAASQKWFDQASPF